MIYREGWAGVAVGLLFALGFGVGAETALVELEELQTWSGGTLGCECGLQLLLELKHLE